LAVSLTTSDGRYFDVFCQETPGRGFVISFTDATAERSAISAMHSINETLESRVEERTAELQEARDLAERANSSKSRFVAAVSHDLLQPLNAAKLFIGSLKQIEQPTQARELTQRIGTAFESVEMILGALLDITKLDSGQLSTDVTVFEVERLLRSVRDEFRHAAEAKGLRLRVRQSDALVRSDYTYLLRILQNLVANAIRYTRGGGVLVAARPRGNSISLEVWDTGVGIPREHRGEIFKEFRRLDENGKAEPGMGLGLAIVERACDLLGHGLSFSSQEGQGSVFRVEVPIVQVDGRTGQKGHLPPMVSLLVDSDEASLGRLTRLLEGWGLNTIEARSGAEARQILNEVGITPDVLFVAQPGDGVQNASEVIDALRAAFGPVPAVLLADESMAELKAHGLAKDLIVMQKSAEPRRLRSILTWIQSVAR